MIDMETMLRFAAAWFVLSIPLAFWAGWTLRRHAPPDVARTWDKIERRDEPLRLTGWRGGTKALALVALASLSACHVVVTRVDEGSVWDFTIPLWVLWVVVVAWVIVLAWPLIARLTGWRR